jgi:rubredoxin-NAD+ reductase
MAGWTTVREFRKHDSTTPVVVVTADSGDFYAKPSLSNALAQKRGPEQLVSTSAAQMAQTLNVTLLAFTRVLQLDTVHQQLTLQAQGASQTLAYARLVLATGAQPIRSAIAGNAAAQVLSVNSLTDFGLFFGRLTDPQGSLAQWAAQTGEDAPAPQAGSKTVLVIGAGLIGCEFANDLLQAGHRVHVVDPSERPLASLLPPGASQQLQEALQALGAQWHLGTRVEAVDTLDMLPTGAGPLCATLADGTQVHADVVLSAIGLRADTALASAAGLQCERGLVVDVFLQTSAPHVYALGDCAQYASAGQRGLPYVMPIMHAARALAATLAGKPTELVFPLMPVSIKTPALPIVLSAAHPAVQGEWRAEADAPAGIWRFHDTAGLQRGFVLSDKYTARRQELAQSTML